jgi:hypothetical protein
MVLKDEVGKTEIHFNLKNAIISISVADAFRSTLGLDSGKEVVPTKQYNSHP